MFETFYNIFFNYGGIYLFIFEQHELVSCF